MQKRLGPVLREADHHALSARKRVSLDAWIIIYGVRSSIGEVVVHRQAEFCRDLMGDIHVQTIAQARNIGLKMIVQRGASGWRGQRFGRGT